MAGGGGVEHPGRCQFGGPIEELGDDEAKRPVTMALRCPARQQVLQAGAPGDGQRGQDMAMRERAADLEIVVAGCNEFVAAKGRADDLDAVNWLAGEVGRRSVFELAILAIALAEQDCAR